MPVVHIDVETRSAIGLDRVSTARYAREESTECLCVAFAEGDGRVDLWTPGEPVPRDFAAMAADRSVHFAAHNANFEFSILEHLLAPRFGWPAIPIERFSCTMVMARAAALPGSLDGAAGALNLEVRKDKDGAKLMREIASRKREPTPADLERLYSYCRQDVEVERELFRRLPPLTESEQALWILDHEINRRGIPIDRELAIAVADLAKQQRVAINAEIAALTGGKITTANQRDRILAWIAADGCEMSGLTKASVKAALENGVGDGVRKLLELRAIGSQAAASKVTTLLAGLDDDDRLRETLVFHGSAPGRWSGRRFQPQNLRKPAKGLDIDAAIAAIKSGELGRVEALGHPLSIAADVSRGLICASPGHTLVGADFGAVESRVLAWLAGETWKLDAYRRFDESGDGADEPYCQIASKILGRTVTPDDKDGRDLGKVADLAGGFGGSVGAWRKFSPKDSRSDEAIKTDIHAFRRAHPRIVRFWGELENALKRAVRRPGKQFTCGRLSAECRDGTLWMTLPSGRAIAYPEAKLVDGKFEDTIDIAFKDNAKGQWREVTEWYGTFVENAVQATARDILAEALVRLEAAGFEIVAHVHDEAIAEIPEGTDRQAEFLAIMIEAPPWADGLPIAGKAWCGQRFVKSDKPAAAPAADEADEAEPTDEIEFDDANGAAHAEREDEPMLDRDPPPRDDADAGLSLSEQLEALGIELSDISPGRRYTTCPKCLAGRKSEHRDDKVLGITLERTSAHFGCNHCGWTGRAGKANGQGPTIHYDYTDEDGVVLFQKVRQPGKFWQRRPDGNGGWVNKLDGVRKVIYRLPAVRKAIAAGRMIVCVEGEKDAETLWSLGIAATTSPDGAATPGQRAKWRSEYSEMLRGADLVVMGDNDAAGRAHVEATAAASVGIAARVRTLELSKHWPACPEGGDISDWWAAEQAAGCASREQLDAILARAKGFGEGEPSGEAVDPADLWGHFDPPPLPEGLLPAVIEEFAKEEADTMGADPVGLVMAALTVCAAALPDRVKLQVKKHNPHWRESARLWAAVVGGVSAKKTPIISRATVAIRRVDWELAEKHEAEMEVYNQLTKEEMKKVKPPTPTRLVIEDTTIEAMQEAVKGNPDGVLKVHDELAGFFGAMEQYSDRAGNSNRAFYLQAYNGGRYVIDRIKRGVIRFENLSMSVLGGIQPEVMRDIAANSIEDGLIQRIIPVMLRDAEAGKDAPGGRAGARYDRLVASLRKTAPPAEPLQLDDAARVIREGLEQKHIKLQRYYAGFNRRLAAHIGKYDGLFARLCLLWHHVEGAKGSGVTENTAQRVAEFMHRFMLPHAVTFYTSILGVTDNHDSVCQVAGYILAKKLTRVTSRDIQSGVAVVSGLKRHEVEVIGDQLESLGWLFRAPGPRRDSAHWDVNPEAHRKFAERAAREVAERAGRRASIMEAAAERRAQRGGDDGLQPDA